MVYDVEYLNFNGTWYHVATRDFETAATDLAKRACWTTGRPVRVVACAGTGFRGVTIREFEHDAVQDFVVEVFRRAAEGGGVRWREEGF